jgi:hypothetical protein
VTAFNDDGRVAWGDLTAREKAARTTQQTFNFSFIVLGAALTVCPSGHVERYILNYSREALHTFFTLTSFLLIV